MSERPLPVYDLLDRPFDFGEMALDAFFFCATFDGLFFVDLFGEKKLWW